MRPSVSTNPARLSAAQPTIEAETALRVVAAALAQARAMGARVNVAVVDAGGVLAGFVRMPGAPLHSVEIAIDKAYTALSFGLPTSQWHDALASHSAAVREGLVLRPRFVGFGGGLPINEESAQGLARIGGIGVSGGSEQQDEEIARAGLVALRDEPIDRKAS